MAVSDQMSSVTRARGMKKKKNLYAPMVQEQAKQGIATQAVAAQKQQALDDADRQFQQDQFDFQKQQAFQRDQQWAAEQQMQQSQFDAQIAAQQKKQNMDMIFGGISTAANLMDTFGGWDAIMDLF